MASHVNLDALIRREDFEAVSDLDDTQVKDSSPITDFTADAFFYGALRKPDFQRETAEWEPERVVGLIRSFVDGELIPGVIVWKNKGLVFVIDGSHRLSALIAWVQDDYGDGARSQEFFNYDIPDDQKRTALRTRQMVEKEFGSYESHVKAMADPTAYSPEIVARARRFGSISLPLQWVKGDAVKAEASFVRINQRAAMITPQELELIESRRMPTAIAARAIIRRGTGHQYWSKFDAKTQQQIKELATELHKLLLEPSVTYPIKTLDLPAGGPVYSATSLRMVYDFIHLCAGTKPAAEDTIGTLTVDYLKLCRRVMWLLLSNHPSSLGLHPAVYFYSWTGKQQPILFLVAAKMMIDYERSNRLIEFTDNRAAFEAFIFANRSLIAQIVRKFGSKSSGTGTHLREFYDFVIDLVAQKASQDEILERLAQDRNWKYLQPAEAPYDAKPSSSRYSTKVKAGVVLRELMPLAPRCTICSAAIPPQAISVDHIDRRQDGGAATVDNAQLAHPYCNTGYKEARHAKKVK